MTWRNTLFLAAILATLPFSAAWAEDAPAPRPKPGSDVTVCAKVIASARYEGYGYTHVIELNNSCDKAVACSVWTNVDPTKVTLQAEPGKSASVVTRKGSPSRDVVARSECKLAR